MSKVLKHFSACQIANLSFYIHLHNDFPIWTRLFFGYCILSKRNKTIVSNFKKVLYQCVLTIFFSFQGRPGQAPAAAPAVQPPVVPQAAPAANGAAQNGGADYSAQWAEYYRSIGKVKEAETIEAQMKQKVYL